MTATRRLAEFAAGLRFDSIPDATVAHTKRLVLDQFACQVGLGPRVVRPVLATARSLSSGGPATAVGVGDKLAVDQAAFVNGTFGHANEIDDAHIKVRTHPGAVVIPAAVAGCEMLPEPTGDDLIAAVVVGYEVMIRVAHAAMPDLMEKYHHHTPVAVGPFGAAAAVGRLLGFDPDVMEHALAIAGSHSGGLMQYTQSGGSVKRIHTGIAAMSGVRSALLSAAGLTGPAEVLEGERGFLRAFAGGGDPQYLLTVSATGS